MKGCLEYLKMKGVYCWRQNSGSAKIGSRFIRFTSINGISDIIGICPDGRFLAVECKRTKGGVVREAQKDFLEQIEKNGGVAVVVNSVESLMQKLKEKKVF